MKISFTIALKIALLIISSICQAQTLSTIESGSNSNLVLKGRVIDATTKNSVPYGNIGIPNKSSGTVANENGEFIYSCPVKFQSDTIYFSSIGYKTLKIILKEFKQLNEGIISLTPEINNLSEVIVKPRTLVQQSKILGNDKRKSRLFGVLMNAGNPGFEAGILMNTKSKYCHIKKVGFFIYSKNVEDTNSYRIRIYDFDSSTKKPGTLLNSENIIVLSAIKRGWVEVDIRNMNIRTDAPFVVSVECLTTKLVRGIPSPVFGILTLSNKINPTSFSRSISMDSLKNDDFKWMIKAEVDYYK